MSELKLVNIQEFLNAIVKLLEYQKNYKLALQGLESFFQNNVETDRKEYLYARVLLLDAYLYNGHFDTAVKLCQELSNSKHQTTKILAQYYLAEIFSEAKPTEQKSSLNSPKSSLTPAQATELINTGYEALTKKRYKEAIRALNIFCQAASPATKEYLQAHKWLIKAYQENEQINQAIALCQQLLINEHEATRKWARQLLFTELFTDSIDVSATAPNPNKLEIKLQTPSENLPEDIEPVIEKFTPKTLKELKVFCQTNLLSELKVFESLRKQVLISIFTAHILFLYLITALIKVFPVVSSFLKNSMYFQVGSSIISIPFLFIIFLFYYLLVFLLFFGIWIFFYAAAFETFSRGFKYKISEQILSYANPNKDLKYVRNSSEEDIINSLEFFKNSQLFQGIIIPNKIVQDDYIHGRINGVNIWFSNICAELELKHYWNNYLNITFFINLRNAPIRISYFVSFLLPFTFYICFVIVRLIKLIPYIFKNILFGKAIESKRIESEILKNEVTRTSLIFKGLFFKAKFHKSLRTVTIVQPKFINARACHQLSQMTEAAR